MEMYGKKASQGINWITTIFMALFHIGAVAALFFFSWKVFFVTLFLWWVSFGWGIGMGYHRLLTHRGFKTPKWMEYFLTVCATLALEGGPIFWVATHRIHHQKSDRDGDPHSPREGLWWSHAGWIITGSAMHHDTAILKRYVPDLSKDKFHVLLTKYHWIPQVVLGIMLLAYGFATGGIVTGIAYVLWGVFLRVTFGLHWTWAVNSVTHVWGSRRFKTRDDSTNNWWVAAFSFGEGWHNNHHAHPTSARHGLAWYEFDINWMCIATLKLFGLAEDVRVAKIAQPVIVAHDEHENESNMPAEAALATSAGYD
jgi:stearoyl-CoA desaturase (delta-9 desaturase)